MSELNVRFFPFQHNELANRLSSTPTGTHKMQAGLYSRVQTKHPPRLMDAPTPIKNHATTEPGGSPLGCHNGTSTPHPQPEALGRPQDTTVTMDGQSLLGHCPWLSSVPHRLLERLLWTTQPTASIQGRDILLLYTGPGDGGALDDILIQQQQDLAPRLLAVDILRPPERGPNDILDDVFYSTLCCAAAGGQLSFVGGGPNCRTWSILRWFPKPGAPRPV